MADHQRGPPSHVLSGGPIVLVAGGLAGLFLAGAPATPRPFSNARSRAGGFPDSVEESRADGKHGFEPKLTGRKACTQQGEEGHRAE